MKTQITAVDSEANSRTFYSRRVVDELRLNLARHDCDAHASERRSALACKTCFYIRGNRVAGQAFTNRKCDACGNDQTFPTTHTLRYCEACAKILELCRDCGADLEGRTRPLPGEKPKKTRRGGR